MNPEISHFKDRLLSSLKNDSNDDLHFCKAILYYEIQDTRFVCNAYFIIIVPLIC